MLTLLTQLRDGQQASYTRLGELADGRRQGNETLTHISTNLGRLVERFPSPPQEKP